uniref:Uncharacterized protein n=1 Tax=Toxoplasma gondii TgCATBr9 TaxID=943120 RepID=A0A2T6IK40_TOXGO|nr:hypothetical protein TGBR9_383970 [Toxoplasma gondii TgCATBr9]
MRSEGRKRSGGTRRMGAGGHSAGHPGARERAWRRDQPRGERRQASGLWSASLGVQQKPGRSSCRVGDVREDSRQPSPDELGRVGSRSRKESRISQEPRHSRVCASRVDFTRRSQGHRIHSRKARPTVGELRPSHREDARTRSVSPSHGGAGRSECPTGFGRDEPNACREVDQLRKTEEKKDRAGDLCGPARRLGSKT